MEMTGGRGRRAGLLALTLALLAGCGGARPEAPAPEPGVQEATRSGPEGAAPGTCWGRTITPAVVETAVRQVQVSPAEVNPDGTVAAAPVYRSETTQQIVSPRRNNWFETPCPDVMTPDFIASVQRALIARAAHPGPVTGRMDAATRSAILRWQTARGTDSATLSLETAQELGLVAVGR